MSDWELVGSIAPEELAESRLELHWAAQLVAAVGSSLAPPEPDDSHTALTCVTERSLLLNASAAHLVALSMPDLRLAVLDTDLADRSSLALAGHTLDEGLGWLASQLDGATLRLPDYEMPPHPVGDGEPFRIDQPQTLDELARWFKNASRVLRDLGVGDDLCWPHHFDLATLQTFDEGKSIGVGLSPGDDSYNEPYWYVAPWPYPASRDLPELSDGHWHHENFVAAILTGSEIAAERDASSQRAKVDSFLDAGIAASRRLIEAASS